MMERRKENRDYEEAIGDDETSWFKETIQDIDVKELWSDLGLDEAFIE